MLAVCFVSWYFRDMKCGKLLIILISVGLLTIAGCKKDKKQEDKNLNESQQKLLELVNNYRKSGCKCGSEQMPAVPVLKWNTLLEKAAKIHADDMDKMNNMTHTGSDGSNGGERIKSVGYNWSTWGENIAIGYPTEEDVVNAWINSEPHCRNIMKAGFKEMGIAKTGKFWAQEFGTQK